MQGLLAVLGLAAILSSAACDDNPFSPSDVLDVTWNLVSVQLPGEEIIAVDDPSDYTVRFENDGSVAVKFDCNTCGGSYTLDGSDIRITGLVCTMVACGGISLDLQYAQALELASTISVSDDESAMTLRGNGATLEFRR